MRTKWKLASRLDSELIQLPAAKSELLETGVSNWVQPQSSGTSEH